MLCPKHNLTDVPFGLPVESATIVSRETFKDSLPTLTKHPIAVQSTGL
jgi:hypothetical protein